MARTLNLGNIHATINGNRVLNLTTTQPVVFTQTGTNAVISVPNATQSSAGLMSAADKTKIDGIQSKSVALGETASTAYRGDRGKIAYDHSQVRTGNPHQVTKAEVGLGSVPNVATNDQTPTYTTASTLTALTSGEVLSTAFGKLSKATNTLISHTADTTVHITAAERGAWNNKVDKVTGKELSANDFTDEYKDKLDGIEDGAEVNEVSALDHGKLTGAVNLLSKEVDVLKKRCHYLETLLEMNDLELSVGTVEGKRGFGYCDNTGTSESLTKYMRVFVDPSLEGTQLYIQCVCKPEDGTGPIVSSSTLNQYRIDEYGRGVLETSLNYVPHSQCYFYVTTTAYVWNASSSSGQTVTANSGAFTIDGYPTNGVDFKLTYKRAIDPEDLPEDSRLDETALSYYDLMGTNGYAPKYEKYASVNDAITGYNNGDTVVIVDNWSLDYLTQSDYWMGNQYIRLTSAPPVNAYSGDYYKETMVPAV